MFNNKTSSPHENRRTFGHPRPEIPSGPDVGRKFLDTQEMCSSPSANYYRPSEEPEPWDLTQLNIEASVMCLVSKVRALFLSYQLITKKCTKVKGEEFSLLISKVDVTCLSLVYIFFY